ncbi:MAG: 1-acyl-sn-glycerol-3-phosphate acyltransferase [Corynebacterium sp.]|uniref:1-acyl-sn-glycerol-3-phosphate acyltransferase n=1 Tax=Corynebacterium sp. TaxID=1720 RepID=UPI0026DC3974|nr:1-acyl-sn-glycerol-3-phosphate acyltransferase [Corynebacterium sp.]MDO5029963.1 1-acyl-sn-glycerol-3-phosphate acyltransferase [Corynebacterium sp.]
MFKDPVYFGVIGLARAVFFAQGLKFTIKGWENVPKKSGAVVVTNHTGYMDFTYVGIPFRKYRRYVRFMAKKEVFDHPIAGPIMRSLKHIPVDRTDGSKSFETACEMLENDELVGIFPESTISRSFEVKNLKTGAVRMAQRTGKPILPVLIVGSQRVWTKGHPKHLGRTNTPIHMVVLPPWHPEGDPVEATDKLHEIMDQGVRQLWDEYAEAEGPLPQGAYWVPTRLGGGAPTFEEAQAEDLKVEEERQRIRHLRSDLASFKDKLAESAREFRGQTKQQFIDASNTVSAESTRAKEQTTAMLAQLRQSVEQMADEVVAGAKESRDSVLAATESMRATFRDTYAQLEKASAASLEQTQQSVYRLIGQSMMIRDKLPQRLDKLITTKPQSFIFDYPGSLVDGANGISEDTMKALEQLAGEGATIIVLHDKGDKPDLTALHCADLKTVELPENASKLDVTNAVAVTLREQARKEESAMLFASREIFSEALDRVGMPVVMADADWTLLRNAGWVVDTAAHGGVVATLEMLADRFCDNGENGE